MEMRLMEREASATHVAVAPPSPPPPPSSTTSPSHEFSFTISLLHPNFSTSNPPLKCNKSPPPPSAFDIDHAPADDIFLHGHLLPRPAIYIEDLPLPLNPNDAPATTAATHQAKDRKKPKPKSLSSFFGFKKDKLVDSDDKKSTRKGLDISRMLKKYASMVLFFMWKKEKDGLRKRPCSFSGNLSNPRVWRPSRRSSGGFSVPASKRTSPTNSGLLLAAPTTASSDGSTMEELQNAIQAANIAHCKSSTGVKDDKCKF